jgi:5-methyltetrahydrofolate--homocysteine methyltransferase
MLRQQEAHGEGAPFRSLADYVSPVGAVPDHVGLFAVTAGLDMEPLLAEYARDHDDYHAIAARALADRLAEAFTELLHARMRAEWGFGEDIAIADLLAEKYRGIRPAPGYPACPDHNLKSVIFRLLDATANARIELTESLAMSPPASVSGIVFGHPAAGYFSVGRIGRDQVSDYARRIGMLMGQAERWLAPNLGYDPE